MSESLQNLIRCAERWHELWAQDQRYTIWENTPEGEATHWAVSEEECAEFASTFDADKMRDDLREAERNLINAYQTAKYGTSTSDQVAAIIARLP